MGQKRKPDNVLRRIYAFRLNKPTKPKKGGRKSAVPIGIFKNIKFYRIALSNDVRNPSVQYPWDFSFSHSKVFILGQKRI